MINLGNKKNFFWDFDGVLMDSMPVRNKGFELVLEDYPKDQVEALMKYHLENGGLSRYVKFRYFFEEIRKESISQAQVEEWSNKFSKIMRRELVNSKLLINDSCNFIKKKYTDFNMHIVSGSDQEELRFICKSLKLDKYFLSINGSPTPKIELVEHLLEHNNYHTNQTLLIGDSINDYEAARANDVDFYGYNNPKLSSVSKEYIENFIE